MVFFHVQRLSGGFVLSFVVGVVGTCIFWIKLSVSAAFAFLAYIMLISTYLNLLGKCSLLCCFRVVALSKTCRYHGHHASEGQSSHVRTYGPLENDSCSPLVTPHLISRHRLRRGDIPCRWLRLYSSTSIPISNAVPRMGWLDGQHSQVH